MTLAGTWFALLSCPLSLPSQWPVVHLLWQCENSEGDRWLLSGAGPVQRGLLPRSLPGRPSCPVSVWGPVSGLPEASAVHPVDLSSGPEHAGGRGGRRPGLQAPTAAAGLHSPSLAPPGWFILSTAQILFLFFLKYAACPGLPPPFPQLHSNTLISGVPLKSGFA